MSEWARDPGEWRHDTGQREGNYAFTDRGYRDNALSLSTLGGSFTAAGEGHNPFTSPLAPNVNVKMSPISRGEARSSSGTITGSVCAHGTGSVCAHGCFFPPCCSPNCPHAAQCQGGTITRCLHKVTVQKGGQSHTKCCSYCAPHAHYCASER
ncbi:MAG: hypothetical protein LBJ70_04690 [Holosporales bacterium]|nr:hypothetical protein [Holosporales bacterium]